MRIYPIKWRRDGFGTRLVPLPVKPPIYFRYFRDGKDRVAVVSPALKCSYYQIWFNGPERYVVDRALTLKRAREIIEQLKSRGFPLFPG